VKRWPCPGASPEIPGILYQGFLIRRANSDLDGQDGNEDSERRRRRGMIAHKVQQFFYTAFSDIFEHFGRRIDEIESYDNER
jgi:hypothetical protein